VFGAGWLLSGWRERSIAWPTLAGGLAVAAVVAGLLLAYPLWRQFYGAQSYRGLPASAARIGTDLAAFPAFPRLSLAGDAVRSARLAANPTEENTFFGWPLLLVVAIGVLGGLWRLVVVRALLLTGVVFAVLALGSPLTVKGEQTAVRLPWERLRGLPLLEHVVPSRFGLVVLAVLGVLVALILDAVLRPPRTGGPVARWLAVAAVLAALAPIVPRPVPVAPVPPPPEFISSGRWRDYVPAGHSLVTVPPTNSRYTTGMRWWAATRGAFAFPGGYFLGPNPAGEAMFGAQQRPTQQLLAKVEGSGKVPEVTDRMRAELRADLAFWRAGALVLPAEGEPSVRHHAALNDLMTRLLGPGEQVGGVTVWRAPA
jgi:hypothetical protein